MKFDRRSIGVKLWLYFILFAAVILSALWLLQTVFLQSFYEGMKVRDIEQTAAAIIEAYGKDDFAETIDKLTYHNSVLVFITDSEGSVLYSSDEHGSGGPSGPDGLDSLGGLGGMKKDNNLPWQMRSLPDDFQDFLKRLAQSDGTVSYIVRNIKHLGKSLIYGVRLPDGALYMSAPIDAVNSTTDIIRTQLLYVTLASLLLSLILAFFIAKRFSKPVRAITHKAGALAQGDFDITFEKGFCSELDDLALALDHTAVELSKVEKLRRELLANVSHDLRTPLTMVKAYTEMIRDISGDNKQKREAHLAVISGEAERLTTLVNDLLDLSVMQSDNETLVLENISLSDAVKKVVSRFRPLLEHEGYSIQTTIEPDQYVLGDGQRLTQVLYNLIGNAINYIGEDKAIVVNLIDQGGSVRFEVTDHGEGIAPEEIPLIWERYYKAQNHQRPKTGTGLGLSIVKGILTLHGARFGVESQVGQGSTFWFELKK